MLEMVDVNVYYGAVHALKGISIKVNQGEIVTLIGANGAGKSTTLKTVSGVLKPKVGKVIFEGNDLTKVKASDMVKLGMSHVPEGRRIFSTMSIIDRKSVV